MNRQISLNGNVFNIIDFSESADYEVKGSSSLFSITLGKEYVLKTITELESLIPGDRNNITIKYDFLETQAEIPGYSLKQIVKIFRPEPENAYVVMHLQKINS